MGAGGRAGAGPTGAPWVEANGWAIRLIDSQSPGKPVWVASTPPRGSRMAAYQLAVADAAAYGARWVATFDEQLRDGLAAGKAEARESWAGICRAVSFFEEHKEWRTLVPAAVMGVMSTFAGPNTFLGGELLNLLARRQVAYRVLDPAAADFSGLHALVYVDADPPRGAAAERLLAFARDGGLLLTPPGFSVEGTPAEEHLSFDVKTVGKGRVGVARRRWSDPYRVAMDAHLLMSRRHDVLRLWNPGSILAHCTQSASGDRAVVHLINYSTREASHEVTLGLTKKYRMARMITFEKTTAIEPGAAAHGIELRLPPVPVYAAIELSS